MLVYKNITIGQSRCLAADRSKAAMADISTIFNCGVCNLIGCFLFTLFRARDFLGVSG